MTLFSSDPITDTQILTQLNSPYYIKDDVVVDQSGTLIIEAGVVLNFHPGAGITVKGSLIAKVLLLFHYKFKFNSIHFIFFLENLIFVTRFYLSIRLLTLTYFVIKIIYFQV